MPECLTYINDVLTVPSGKGSDVQAARQADGTTVLTGFVAADVQAKSIDLAMQDPALCTARLTRAALASRGILVTGTARMATAEESIADFQVLATHSSEPLGQVATELLKRSQNLYAEMLLRHFAVESRGKTGEAGLGVVEDVLRTAGVPDDAYRLYDGSGLSRYEVLSAEALNLVLRWSWGRPWRQVLLEALPLGGVGGTLSCQDGRGPAVGKVQAKTGSMTGVFALTGYVTHRRQRSAHLCVAQQWCAAVAAKYPAPTGQGARRSSQRRGATTATNHAQDPVD
ncbi:MAG: D-alanyl-D-alanine carboxypeptidase/D-alanyl-D-alanine-endopeptidase [Myxococcota bacterium]